MVDYLDDVRIFDRSSFVCVSEAARDYEWDVYYDGCKDGWSVDRYICGSACRVYSCHTLFLQEEACAFLSSCEEI